MGYFFGNDALPEDLPGYLRGSCAKDGVHFPSAQSMTPGVNIKLAALKKDLHQRGPWERGAKLVDWSYAFWRHVQRAWLTWDESWGTGVNSGPALVPKGGKGPT
jgi:hypothetical protein